MVQGTYYYYIVSSCLVLEGVMCQAVSVTSDLGLGAGGFQFDWEGGSISKSHSKFKYSLKSMQQAIQIVDLCVHDSSHCSVSWSPVTDLLQVRRYNIKAQARPPPTLLSKNI